MTAKGPQKRQVLRHEPRAFTTEAQRHRGTENCNCESLCKKLSQLQFSVPSVPLWSTGLPLTFLRQSAAFCGSFLPAHCTQDLRRIPLGVDRERAHRYHNDMTSFCVLAISYYPCAPRFTGSGGRRLLA
jgi:hypothetical protein